MEMCNNQFTVDEMKSIKSMERKWVFKLSLRLLGGLCLTHILINKGFLGWRGPISMWYIAIVGYAFKTSKPFKVKEKLLVNAPEGWYKDFTDRELIDRYCYQRKGIILGTDYFDQSLTSGPKSAIRYVLDAKLRRKSADDDSVNA